MLPNIDNGDGTTTMYVYGFTTPSIGKIPAIKFVRYVGALVGEKPGLAAAKRAVDAMDGIPNSIRYFDVPTDLVDLVTAYASAVGFKTYLAPAPLVDA